jgi:predicted  nucleic acid-binding Zn-ribbon protein
LPPRRSSARRSDRKRSRSPGGKDEGGDASGDLSEARAHNAELEKRLAALEDAVARSKGSEDSQAARADALESALESAVERQRRRKGLVKKVVKAGAKATRCREELRDAEERLAGALREAQEAIEDAAGDDE